MRFGGKSNRRTTRFQAAFVAVLYLFLSTFGTLTHTHVGTAGLFESAGASPRSASAAHLDASSDRNCAPNTSCAICEWQASSVSAALPIFHIVHLVAPRDLRPVSLTDALHPTVLFGFSSRAPPTA